MMVLVGTRIPARKHSLTFAPPKEREKVLTIELIGMLPYTPRNTLNIDASLVGHSDSGKLSSAQTLDSPYAFSDAESNEDHGQMTSSFQIESALEASDAHQTITALDISPELQTVASNIQAILNLRQKFIQLSLQRSQDNPRDLPGWKIYPPPPDPTWDENKARPATDPGKAGEEAPTLKAQSPTAKKRKPGHNVGEDFDLGELEPCPGVDPDVDYRLNKMSIFQSFQSSKTDGQHPLVDVPDLRTYYKAMDDIQCISSDGPTKSFAYRQLDILEGKFQLYHLVNSYQETADCKRVPHRDFYNVRKVDTHVHHSACMNQKHLLRFIKSKMKKSPNEVVMFRDGRELTLQEVFDSIQLNAYDLRCVYSGLLLHPTLLKNISSKLGLVEYSEDARSNFFRYHHD